jgi:hypothetical protein
MTWRLPAFAVLGLVMIVMVVAVGGSNEDSLAASCGVGSTEAPQPSGPGGTFSQPELESLWVAAGGPRDQRFVASAIAMAESGGDPNAGADHPYHGLWQVGPGGSFDPMENAREAVQKYKDSLAVNGDGWIPWTTYTGADTPNHERTYLRWLRQGMETPSADSQVCTGDIRQISGSQIQAAYQAAQQIDAQGFGYVWGGGHAHAGTPDTGVPGPSPHDGPVGPDEPGYDCSGAVAAILAAAQLYPAGQAVPSSDQLPPAAGAVLGEGSSLTLYASPAHIYARFTLADGSYQFWGTSGENPRGGAGFHGARSGAGFVAWHFQGL